MINDIVVLKEVDFRRKYVGRSDVTKYVKSTSLISTLNICLFFLSNSSSDISYLQKHFFYDDSSIPNNWTLQKSRG